MAVWNPSAAWLTSFCDDITRLEEAAETQVVNFADYSADPTTGWGNTERGVLLLDDGWGGAGIGSDLDPRLCVYQKVASAGTNAKRYLSARKLVYATTPAAVTFTPAGPYVADQAYTDLDMSALLDGAGFQDYDDLLVTEVVLAVSVVDTGTLGTGAANSTYAMFRKKGTTNEVRVPCQVSGVVNYATILVGVDANEILQWGVVAANTSPSFTLTADLVGFMETL